METNETIAKPSPWSVGLKFGVLLGLVSIAINVVQTAVGFDPNENQAVNNIIGIVTSVAVLIFAHKNFKDNGDGFMSYAQGLGIATIMTVLSTVILCVYMYVYFNMINPSAFSDIWDKVAADMEAKGESDEAIEMAQQWGRKLFWIFFPLAMIFWGFIIGLIVSIFTQKKKPETTF